VWRRAARPGRRADGASGSRSNRRTCGSRSNRRICRGRSNRRICRGRSNRCTGRRAGRYPGQIQ